MIINNIQSRLGFITRCRTSSDWRRDYWILFRTQWQLICAVILSLYRYTILGAAAISFLIELLGQFHSAPGEQIISKVGEPPDSVRSSLIDPSTWRVWMSVAKNVFLSRPKILALQTISSSGHNAFIWYDRWATRASEDLTLTGAYRTSWCDITSLEEQITTVMNNFGMTQSIF